MNVQLGVRMRRLPVLAGVVAAATIAACSSSSSNAAAPTPSTRSGTEAITGTVTGAAVVQQQNPTFHLTFAGPVNTTSTWTPPGGNAKSLDVTFKTGAGNMVVHATMLTNPNSPPTIVNAAACRFSFVTKVKYDVLGAQSTGSFKDATGSGNVDVAFTANAPKKNGQCNQNAQPTASSAVATFRGDGPLSVKV
jgi:hypothetical protein